MSKWTERRITFQSRAYTGDPILPLEPQPDLWLYAQGLAFKAVVNRLLRKLREEANRHTEGRGDVLMDDELAEARLQLEQAMRTVEGWGGEPPRVEGYIDLSTNTAEIRIPSLANGPPLTYPEPDFRKRRASRLPDLEQLRREYHPIWAYFKRVLPRKNSPTNLSKAKLREIVRSYPELRWADPQDARGYTPSAAAHAVLAARYDVQAGYVRRKIVTSS